MMDGQNNNNHELEAENLPFYERPLSQYEKTESYLKYHYGSKVKELTKRRNSAKFEKFIILIVLVVLLAALISWGIIGYNHTQKINNENINKINALDLKFQLLAQKLQSLRNVAPENSDQRPPTPKSSAKVVNQAARSKKSGASKQDTSGTQINKIALKLVGDDSDFESQKGEAIRGWMRTPYMQKGSISFSQGKYIQVGKAGLYMIQARMFLKGNTKTDETTLSYAVSKWNRNPNYNNNLAVASIQRNSCSPCCSLSISEVVLLKAHDRIFLETAESGLKFKMAPDKTSFSCYLLI